MSRKTNIGSRLKDIGEMKIMSKKSSVFLVTKGEILPVTSVTNVVDRER